MNKGTSNNVTMSNLEYSKKAVFKNKIPDDMESQIHFIPTLLNCPGVAQLTSFAYYLTSH